MTNAQIDGNDRPTMIGVSNTNGTSIVRVTAVPTNHGLSIVDGTGQADLGNNGNNAMLDDNSKQVLLAVSSVDGVTPVEVYVKASTGQILVDMI